MAKKSKEERRSELIEKRKELTQQIKILDAEIAAEKEEMKRKRQLDYGAIVAEVFGKSFALAPEKVKEILKENEDVLQKSASLLTEPIPEESIKENESFSEPDTSKA